MQVGWTRKLVGGAIIVLAFGWLCAAFAFAAPTAQQSEKLHSAAKALTKAETLYKSGKMAEATAAFESAQKSLADLAEADDLAKQRDPLVKRLNSLRDNMALDGAKLPAIAAELATSSAIGAGKSVGWRGDGTGHFPSATPPISWERTRGGTGYTTKGIVWATPLPSSGISSPIVVGDRIFVTTEGADLVCIDKASGRLLWIRSNPEFEGLSDEDRKAEPAFAETLAPLAAQLKEADAAAVDELNAEPPTAATSAYHVPPTLEKKRAIEKEIQNQLNGISKKRFDHSWPQAVYGYCTETPASDGQHVCAYFGTGVSACYDLKGNRKWIVRGQSGGEEKGNFTSPLLMNHQFIVWGGREIRAYDVETGKVVWSHEIEGANASSLFAVRVGKELVAGFRNYFVRVPDGKEIWRSGGMDNSTQTPVVDGDMIYTWFGAGAQGAFRALQIPSNTDDGKPTPGVTYKTEWASDDLPKSKSRPFDREMIASPLLVDGLIYRICCGGGLIVNDASSGEIVYTKILPLKPHTEYWAWGGAAISPSLAGKYIYLMDNQGGTVIIQPGRTYKEIAVNHIEESKDGKEQVQNLANLVFEGSRIYYRTPDYLYCIGEK
jgi:outer membrane protein assembly factor BamB